MKCSLIVVCVFALAYGSSNEEEDFSYHVMLKTNTKYCSGSLIADDVVLTAAHCLTNEDIDNMKVYVGYTTLNVDFIPSNELRSVSTVKVHEFYDQKSSDYDVALLYLVETLIPNDNVRTVEIGTEAVPPGTVSVICGWEETKINSYKLTTKETTIVSVAVNVSDRFLSTDAFDTSCDGDSGRPLIVNGKQIGIAAQEENCNGGTSYVMYTSLSLLYPWIQANIQK